jgi:guanylate kinase
MCDSHNIRHNTQQGRIVIFSAPSGSGKSTLINYLLTQMDCFEFSISATSRSPRGTEVNGKEYYFLTPEEFKQKIEQDEFLEWEEVYKDRFYGTLKSEVDRIFKDGKVVLFDVDVIGGLNIKKYYGESALAVFIQPPGIEELRYRLNSRATDSQDVINSRIEKAEYELSFAPRFDKIIINDNLQTAQQEVLSIVTNFLKEK